MMVAVLLLVVHGSTWAIYGVRGFAACEWSMMIVSSPSPLALSLTAFSHLAWRVFQFFGGRTLVILFIV